MAHRSIPRFVPPVILLLLAGLGYIYWSSTRPGETSSLKASGTIEAPGVLVGPEIAGRVVEVAVQEGQAVSAGDLLFRLDDELLAAQRGRVQAALESARAAVDTAQTGLDAARLQHQMAFEAAHLEAGAANPQPWRGTLPDAFEQPIWYFSSDEVFAASEDEADSAKQALEAAEADLASLLQDEGGNDLVLAEARLARAEQGYLLANQILEDARRSGLFDDLRQSAEDQFDAASDELDAAQSALADLLDDAGLEAVSAARAEVAVAQARYDSALASAISLHTGEHSLKLQAAGIAIAQAQAALDQAQKGVEQAQAELRLVELQIEKARVVAPIDGVILARSVEVGEVLQPGAGAIRIGRLDSLTLKVFVPEDRLGQIGLGDPAAVTTDSFPGTTFEATVARVADEAEFTPRNVQTEEGRRTTVFQVELSIDDASGRLKPGMPADVDFGLP